MTADLLVVPESVPVGRFGTWQYDVTVQNPGPHPLTITNVEWRLYRRDGKPPLHTMAALSGNPDPALFFPAAEGAVVTPGQRVRGRAAHFSHWEAPLVDWRVTIKTAGDNAPREFTAQVRLNPAPLEAFMYAPDREAVLATPQGTGPFPALLILHPYGGSARAMGWAAIEAAANGWVGMAISQPGFGGSAGPLDYAGPASQQAARQALEVLRAHPLVQSQPIGVWGISLGAMLAGLVASRSTLVAAAALQAGVYDLELHHRLGGLAWLEREGIPGIVDSEDELAARSVIANARSIHCPVLILHGSADKVAPVDHAQRLYELLKARDVPVELALLEQYGHGLPPLRVWKNHLVPFFNRNLGTP